MGHVPDRIDSCQKKGKDDEEEGMQRFGHVGSSYWIQFVEVRFRSTSTGVVC